VVGPEGVIVAVGGLHSLTTTVVVDCFDPQPFVTVSVTVSLPVLLNAL